jgi:hypothetical protein
VDKFFKFSGFQLVGLALCTVVGLIVGSSFVWAAPSNAWTYLIMGFLWVLLISAATGLGRCVRERLQRGDWVRGIAIGSEMSFPNTTMFLLAVLLASLGAAETTVLSSGASVMSKPDMLMVAPIFYSITLAMAVIIGPVYTLTSPFGVKQKQ